MAKPLCWIQKEMGEYDKDCCRDNCCDKKRIQNNCLEDVLDRYVDA
jgi:hypothetical protein